MFYWLRAPWSREDAMRDEWILAIARILFSASCFIGAVWLEGGVRVGLPQALAFSFLGYSLIIVVALRLRPRLHPLFTVVVHCADIVWAANVAVLVGNPGVFLAMSVMVMVSAAARWGLWECVSTACAFCAFIVLADLYDGIPLRPFFENAFEPAAYMPIGFALTMGIGLIAEAKCSRWETYAVQKNLFKIRFQSGFGGAIEFIGSLGSQRYGASRMLVATRDTRSGLTSLYRAERPQDGMTAAEIPPSRRDQYLFLPAAAGWRIDRATRRGRDEFKCFRLDGGKISRDRTGFRPPDAFLEAHPFRRMLCVWIQPMDGLSIHFFILDPDAFFSGAAGLRFMSKAAQQTVPILRDMLDVGRMRKDAEADASSRLARDLHDGVIQSLVGIQLQLDQVRRNASSVFSQSAEALGRIEQSVRREIASLRELTLRARSHEVDSGSFLGFLSNLALRFQCEHGIETSFASEVQSVQLPPRVCSELARIALEALVNVRKHSGASEVFIRLALRNGDLVLSVEDNGCGFGFSGKYGHEELLASGKGPSVIIERARTINARVTIESIRERGSILEISLPQG